MSAEGTGPDCPPPLATATVHWRRRPAEETSGAIGVVSLDLDGTMEFGDPSGPLAGSLVTGLQALGYLVGSCSDRTRLEQLTYWTDASLEPDFVCNKPELAVLRCSLTVPSYLHVGDTDVDAHFAKRASFAFMHVHEMDVHSALSSVVEHRCDLGQLLADVAAKAGCSDHG